MWHGTAPVGRATVFEPAAGDCPVACVGHQRAIARKLGDVWMDLGRIHATTYELQSQC